VQFSYLLAEKINFLFYQAPKVMAATFNVSGRKTKESLFFVSLIVNSI